MTMKIMLQSPSCGKRQLAAETRTLRLATALAWHCIFSVARFPAAA